MSRVLFTLNEFHKARHSTKLIMWKYGSGYMQLCVERKVPELWILHHVSAPAHKTLSVKMFMAQKSITEMEHPHYSPDLAALNDFWLFPELKSALKGRKFQDTDDI
jgi:hypothetical protein